MICNEIVEKMVDVVQDCHLNFLIGSGINKPYLDTLGAIEKLLTELEYSDLDESLKLYIKASILKKFFDGSVKNNISLLSDKTPSGAKSVLNKYIDFLSIWTNILLKRKGSLLGKQINLFTTNYDIFLERALEDLRLEFNDGFSGRFNPIFSTSNFRKTYSKRTLYYDNISELPVFNLLKIHGSLTWKVQEQKIRFSNLSCLDELAKLSARINSYMSFDNDISNLDELLRGKDHSELAPTPEMHNFLNAYTKLAIVNPSKAKFRETTIDKNYYDLLRIFANELEKENVVLFILGFSMADEHIRELIIRAANSNPTLLIYVFAFNSTAKKEIERNLGNTEFGYKNLQYLIPPIKDGENENNSEKEYSFENINNFVFKAILKKILQNKNDK